MIQMGNLNCRLQVVCKVVDASTCHQVSQVKILNQKLAFIYSRRGWLVWEITTQLYYREILSEVFLPIGYYSSIWISTIFLITFFLFVHLSESLLLSTYLTSTLIWSSHHSSMASTMACYRRSLVQIPAREKI